MKDRKESWKVGMKGKKKRKAGKGVGKEKMEVGTEWLTERHAAKHQGGCLSSHKGAEQPKNAPKS